MPSKLKRIIGRAFGQQKCEANDAADTSMEMQEMEFIKSADCQNGTPSSHNSKVVTDINTPLHVTKSGDNVCKTHEEPCLHNNDYSLRNNLSKNRLPDIKNGIHKNSCATWNKETQNLERISNKHGLENNFSASDIHVVQNFLNSTQTKNRKPKKNPSCLYQIKSDDDCQEFSCQKLGSSPRGSVVYNPVSSIVQSGSLALLPDDMILHICSFLPRDSSYTSLRFCCRRFHTLLSTTHAVRCTSLRIQYDVKPKLILAVLLQSFNLRVLDVSDCPGISDNFLTYVAKNCRGIAQVNVSGCPLVTDAALLRLGHYLRRIISLYVARSRHITCEGILGVIKKHQQSIRHLDVSSCFNMKSNAYQIAYFSEYCTNLSCLSFGWDRNHIEWIPMWETRISQLCKACPKLQSLDLSCSPSRDIQEVIEAVAQSCTKLRHLNLSHCFIRDKSLHAIAKMEHLEHIDFSHCTELSPEALSSILVKLQNVRHLNLTGCFKLTDEAVNLILQKMTLSELRVRDCYLISDKGLSKARTFCPGLNVLDVSGTMISYELARELKALSDRFLLITENCPNVSAVDPSIWHRMPMVTVLKPNREIA